MKFSPFQLILTAIDMKLQYYDIPRSRIVKPTMQVKRNEVWEVPPVCLLFPSPLVEIYLLLTAVLQLLVVFPRPSRRRIRLPAPRPHPPTHSTLLRQYQHFPPPPPPTDV